MSILKILEFPDDRLRARASPAKVPDVEIDQLVTDMAETMYQAPGIGLAATQVNHPVRLFVMDLSSDQNELQVFINPQISGCDGQVESEEGCLSVPEYFESVQRSESIQLDWQDQSGGHHQAQFEGLAAICIQHEIDHLDGVLFVDHISRLKRERIRKKLSKNRRQTEVL